MSKEILEGVKLVEKEKGIEPGTLLAAIEDALLAAYRKMPDARHPVRVDLDRDTGDFTAWTVTEDAWQSYLDAHPHHHVLAEAPTVEEEPPPHALSPTAARPHTAMATLFSNVKLFLPLTSFSNALGIGATGFEPATARPPAECATRLRHAPCGLSLRLKRGSGRRGSNP